MRIKLTGGVAQDAPSVIEDTDWAVGLVSCDLCTHEWVAVWEGEAERLECPHCNNLTTYTVEHGK